MPDMPEEMRPPLPDVGPMGANTQKIPMHVVALKKGVSERTAKPEDFKRYQVSAAHGNEAMDEARALAEAEGYEILMAITPNQFSEAESLARARASELEPLDRSKI